jgi:hypothetical protein
MGETFDYEAQEQESRRIVKWLKSGSSVSYDQWRKEEYPNIGPYKYRMDLIRMEI